MISSLGQGLVLMALLACALGAPIGFVAGAQRSQRRLLLTRRLAYAFAVLIGLATLLMEVALVRHDFSVSYVAKVGSLATPLHITMVSLWSSLDGSILLWGLVLGAFTAGVARRARNDPEHTYAYTLGTLLTVGAFFTFLIAGPADPFVATPHPVPSDGPGPNPLLQNHPLMIIHPPMLYLGYVGMSVPFAMAVAALLRGGLSLRWLRVLRAALLVPTGCLTLGIMLGGWWSYEVLGWGGYWAWDPVENASFLPWLSAVAAIHSALVLERRGTLKGWTVILVLVTFLLTILGTFLTRSGIVRSVHSFTQSPIGPAFLVFLGICLVAVVMLLAWRLDRLVSGPARERLLAREGTLLLNNLLLLVFLFTVLIGTLFPIIAEAVRGVKVSVGEPYFDRMASPVCLGLLLLLGVGPALPWGRASAGALKRALLWPLPAGLAGLGLTALLGGRGWGVLLTGFLAGYALWVNLDQGSRPARRRRRHGERWPRAVATSLLKAPRLFGAYAAHFGVIVTFVAIAVSSSYQRDQEATLEPGGEVTVGGYHLTFDEVTAVEQPHRSSLVARMQVRRSGRDQGTLEPALAYYHSRREPIGTPAVRTTLSHDLYLTLMNVGVDGSIGLRAIVTPAVVWIWIGIFLLTAGTALCLVPAAPARSSLRAGEVRR